jgi:hypothetical protein
MEQSDAGQRCCIVVSDRVNDGVEILKPPSTALQTRLAGAERRGDLVEPGELLFVHSPPHLALPVLVGDRRVVFRLLGKLWLSWRSSLGSSLGSCCGTGRSKQAKGET